MLQCLPLLRRWLEDSDGTGDLRASTCLNAHVAVCLHAVLREATFSGETDDDNWSHVELFLGSVAAVTSWFSQEEAEEQEKEKKQQQQQQQQQQHHSEGAGNTSKGSSMVAAAELGAEADDGFEDEAAIVVAPWVAHVPLYELYHALQSRRAQLLGWVARAATAQRHRVLQHMVTCALRQPGLVATGWQQVRDQPLMCRLVLESHHPYLPSQDLLRVVTFPGATHVAVSCDPRTRTEADSDCISFYKDETCTQFWGRTHKYSGASSWPGVKGHPPLVIPADSLCFRFQADSTTQA